MRKISLLGVLCLALLFIFGCGAKPVAVVNGEEISMERFERHFNQLKIYMEHMGMSFEGEEGKEQLASLKEEALDGLVHEVLVMQMGEKEGIIATDEEVSTVYEEQITDTPENEEKYKEWLETFQMTDAEYQEKIRYQLTEQKLFELATKDVSVTDQEAKENYETDKEFWDKIQVSHILIDVPRDTATETELGEAKEKALSIIKELDQGASFAELAKEHSADEGTGANGGVLDMEFTKNETGLVPEFVEGAFALENLGDYSKEPVLSQYGYHILKLDVKKGSFAEMAEEIKDQLIQAKKNQIYTEYMEKLHAEGQITKDLPK